MPPTSDSRVRYSALAVSNQHLQEMTADDMESLLAAIRHGIPAPEGAKIALNLDLNWWPEKTRIRMTWIEA